MPSAAKVEKVQKLKERLTEAEAAVFADFRGLTVSDANELRTELAEADAAFAVVKNTLALIAIKEAKLDGLEAFVDGPTAIAFVKGDMVAATKKLVDAGKRFPVLAVRGGWAEGRVLTAEDVKALAALESREVMLAKIAGMAKSQTSRVAYLAQALQAKFLSLLEAYREKLPAGEAGEAPSATQDPADDEEPTPAKPTPEQPEGGPEPEPEEQEAAGEADEGVADAAAGAEAGDTPGEEAAPAEGGSPDEETERGEGGS